MADDNSNKLIPVSPTHLPANDEFQDTLDYVKKNQIEIIEKGTASLENLLIIADSSQHPRAYEVLATYLKTLSEINKDLIETASKKKSDLPPEPSKVTNVAFIGSTKELAAMLKAKKNNGQS